MAHAADFVRICLAQRGDRYGVGSWDAVQGRDWTAAGFIPGLVYGVPPDGTHIQETGRPSPTAPAWPGRFLMRPPPMRGHDVRQWQQQMKARGWKVRINGVYDKTTEEICVTFQEEKGLRVDGVVGEDTWRAAWLAPVT